VTGFLRFVGVLNIAVWLGAAIFFTFFAGPAIFSNEMKDILGAKNFPYFSGAVAQLLVGRYFDLQLVCGALSLLHLLAEWLYLGKITPKRWLGLLAGLILVGLFGGFLLQPRLKQWHAIRYSSTATVEQREAAGRSFKTWHAGSQIANLLMLTGLAGYLWRVANPEDQPRFVSTTKFRG
jgi:hypothetical protein